MPLSRFLRALAQWIALSLCFGMCCATIAPAEEFTVEQLDFFERRIRPLLVEHCLECHNHELAESGLRLDAYTHVLHGGDRGPSVVAGKPDASPLIRAVSYEDEELAMPPGGKLQPRQIADLRKWVRQGAAWPHEIATALANANHIDPMTHWAFRAVNRTDLPRVNDKSWPRNPIDQFVLAKLEAAKLVPSATADPETLVRRAFLDLTGLPPAHEDVQAFVENPSADGFSNLIDRLLSSRSYGERWGRHWLDVARYGDTKGYVDGGQRRFAFAYTYRDYVIQAMNEDLPYDEFVRDQLAADHREYIASQQWRLAALGFLTVGRRFNHNFHDTLDDQIDVISRGLQGLTVSCARCHDHKFDPIPTADYYSLHGILANAEEPQHSELPLLECYGVSDSADHLNELNKRAKEYERKYIELHEKIQDEMRSFAGDYLLYVLRESPRHRDGSQNPLNTDRTILRGPTAYGYGSIRRWRDYLQQQSEDDPVFGVWRRMESADQAEFDKHLVVALKDKHVNQLVREQLSRAKPTSMIELVKAFGDLLESNHARWQEYSEANPTAEGFPDSEADVVRQVLYGPDAAPVMSAFESIDCYHLDDHTEMRNLAGKVEELSLEDEAAAPRAMVLRERSVRYQPVVFLRGQPNRPGQKVSERIPRAFMAVDRTHEDALAESAPGRLGLASTIVSKGNPLAARVLVNRVWHWHLGRPLVETMSDFGVRSSPPSHPELLDYLAAWFMDHGWSLKKLHRLIMTSRTYQQSSVTRPEALALDPQNRLIWRYNARRLEWEVIRDSLLAAAGRLVDYPGGKPIESEADDPDSHCRTVYSLVDRQYIPRFARNFDFPSPDFTSPQRPITIVPQQQLFFLNSPFVWKQAEALGQWVVDMNVMDSERFRALHRRILSRDTKLSNVEIQEIVDGLQREQSPNVWSIVAHGMLQSNAFVTIE